MRRNCNLELRLLPSPTDFGCRRHHRDRGSYHMMGESSVSPQNQQQQLTIFYNGRICVCDVTEFQARAIISMASREMEEIMKTPTPKGSMEDRMKTPTPKGSEPATSSIESQLYNSPDYNNTGLSMKRSLQRFLQKRKHRSLATSPYHY